MNRHGAAPLAWPKLVLAIVWLSGVACLVTPPLREQPTEPNVKFEFSVRHITPLNDLTFFLDRDAEDVIEFGIMEVRDRNLGDETRYQYQLDIDGLIQSPPAGTLRIDPVASEERGITIYEPVLLSVDSCNDDLRTARDVTISLRLEQDIPFEQVDPDNPELLFEDIVVWSVRLEGLCPSES